MLNHGVFPLISTSDCVLGNGLYFDKQLLKGVCYISLDKKKEWKFVVQYVLLKTMGEDGGRVRLKDDVPFLSETSYWSL